MLFIYMMSINTDNTSSKRPESYAFIDSVYINIYKLTMSYQDVEIANEGVHSVRCLIYYVLDKLYNTETHL